MPPDTTDARASREALTHDLEDLITALERRVPQIDRLGEREIASDAAALKQKAMDRLKQLSGFGPGQPASPGAGAAGDHEESERSNR